MITLGDEIRWSDGTVTRMRTLDDAYWDLHQAAWRVACTPAFKPAWRRAMIAAKELRYRYLRQKETEHAYD